MVVMIVVIQWWQRSSPTIWKKYVQSKKCWSKLTKFKTIWCNRVWLDISRVIGLILRPIMIKYVMDRVLILFICSQILVNNIVGWQKMYKNLSKTYKMALLKKLAKQNTPKKSSFYKKTLKNKNKNMKIYN